MLSVQMLKRLKFLADNDGLFSCPVYFASTEDSEVNENAGNMFGIIYLKRSQKWLKFSIT